MKPLDLVWGCGGILLLAVIFATVSMVAEVRKAARKRGGVTPDATGWQRVNQSVQVWHADDQDKQAAKREAEDKEQHRRRVAGEKCMYCRSKTHTTNDHAGF